MPSTVTRPLLTLLIFAATASPAFAEADRPNVLILFTDDQRADTVAALGNPDIVTPNLDALARRGCSLSNTYCLGANMAAVCRPSRNMLLSGRTYFRWTDPTDGSRPANNAPRRDDTLPAVFNAAGYETYHHGKQGNTAERIHGQFDHTHYLADFDDRWSMEAGRKVVDDAIGFLNGRDDNSPWLMYLAFATPHDPRAASTDALSRYDAASLTLPDNRLPAHPFDNGSVIGRDEWTSLWPRGDDRLRGHYHDYYAVITTIDQHIGRLIERLGDDGQLENTIVVFTSDHGLSMGSQGLMGKQNVYEAGYKPPMIIAGPGVRRGSSDHLNYLLDLFPTLCDLTGVEKPSTLDGRSFAGVLRDPDASPIRDSIMLSYTDTQRAVRRGDWKMIRYPQIDRTQLFNLADDPGEIHDLSDDPAQADRIESLMEELQRLMAQAGDRQPLSVDDPASGEFIPPVATAAEQASAIGEGVFETTVAGSSDSDGTPFVVARRPGEMFVAVAVGTDRADDSVVDAIRFDLIDPSKGNRSRRSVIAGDMNARFAPLADEIKSHTQPTMITGRAGEVLHSLGFVLAAARNPIPGDPDAGRHVPAFGGTGGEPFSIAIPDAAGSDASKRFVGFTGTTTERDGRTVIQSLGLLYRE